MYFGKSKRRKKQVEDEREIKRRVENEEERKESRHL
jgi:hypothetical protein